MFYNLLDENISYSPAKLIDKRFAAETNPALFITKFSLLYQNKCTRTISLNSQYIVLFRNFRDGAQILHLARQIYPSNPWLLIDAYEDATKKPFGHIVINMHPRYTDDTKRLQTGILPHEERAYYKPM